MNTRRFSVSILEKGGRLGLKCLLLSYFRVGDNPGVRCREGRFNSNHLQNGVQEAFEYVVQRHNRKK